MHSRITRRLRTRIAVCASAATLSFFTLEAAQAAPDVLAEIVEFTYLIDGEPGRMRKGDILGHVVTHGASHRGAIGKMLGDAKVKGAPDMMTAFRRPAADRI